MQEKRYNEHSQWKKYIDVIPKTFTNCPMFFNEQDKELLKNTEIEKSIEIQSDAIRFKYTMLCAKVPDFA
jgi:hypothetical protein